MPPEGHTTSTMDAIGAIYRDHENGTYTDAEAALYLRLVLGASIDVDN